jgi:ABC-type Co2+ transport system permease subunit
LADQRLSAKEEITAPAGVMPSLLSATGVAGLMDCQVVVTILVPRVSRVDKKAEKSHRIWNPSSVRVFIFVNSFIFTELISQVLNNSGFL